MDDKELAVLAKAWRILHYEGDHTTAEDVLEHIINALVERA